MSPREAEREEQDEQIGGFPRGVDLPSGLRHFDGRDCLLEDRLAVSARLVEDETLQLCPGDHPEVFVPGAGQIVDGAGELGHRVSAESDRTIEICDVDRHHLPEQRFFVTEVGVEAFLAGARGTSDPIDPRAGETVAGELCAGLVQNLTPQSISASSHSRIITVQTSSFATLKR